MEKQRGKVVHLFTRFIPVWKDITKVRVKSTGCECQPVLISWASSQAGFCLADENLVYVFLQQNSYLTEILSITTLEDRK